MAKLDTTSILENIFGQIPLIETFKVNFERGTRESFDLYISQNNYGIKYPIIWEVLPTKTDVIDETRTRRKLTLLIASKSNNEKSRDYEVIKKEFYFLNKILDYVINGFTKSNATTFDNTYSYEERPNYYENNKSIQTDILNVIVLEIEVEFKVINCLNTIIWE